MTSSMKKLVVVLAFAFIAVKMFSQDPIRFLGIPVDGTEKDMIAALKSKGFEYDSTKECLYGEFNGEDVELHIVTNKNKVWRIYVEDRYPRDEYQIKLRYNRLCEQFENNPRYTSFIAPDQTIPMEEDIFHEMRGNDKHYEACFYQVVADSSPISEDLSELGEQYIEDYGYPYLYDEDSLVQQDSMTVRLERPADYRETELVVREAFWNCYSPGCMEHYLLHVMRDSPGFVPELDFVAESGNRIIGSVVFMKSFILGDDGSRYEVLTMGPLAVHPSFQCRGVGRLLTGYACSSASEKGYRVILLCGDPEYYGRVGFTAAERYGIRTSENRYHAALHVRPLYENAMDGMAGRYFENEIYMVDGTAAAVFDRQFPYKVPVSGTPSQRRFEEVSSMQKDYITKSA